MEDMVGMRFHPSEQEIISYYLHRKLRGLDFPDVINEVDINQFEPWDLPAFSVIESEDPVWYFFYVPDYTDGGRTRINRKTKAGFWKATGKDRPVKDKRGKEIGTKRTLVFLTGRSPNGVPTNWAMQEFHYKDATKSFKRPFVLCRLKRKSNDSRSHGREQPSPASASTSANSNTVDNDIVQLVNDEPLDDFLSLDHDSFLQLQLLLQQPSSSNESLHEPDTSRFQLDTSKQEEDDFVNSLWATDEENLREETVHTRRHGLNPVETLSGVIPEDSKDLNVKAAIVLQDSPMVAQMSFERAEKLPRLVGGSPAADRLQRSALERFKEVRPLTKDSAKRAEIRRMTTSKSHTQGPIGSNRERGFIFLETPLSSQKQDPPSVYIVNIVVALVLFVFFVREMVYVR